MIKDNLVVIETERLFIKKIVSSDFRNFLSLHQNASVMQHFDGGAKTLEQAKRRFNDDDCINATKILFSSDW